MLRLGAEIKCDLFASLRTETELQDEKQREKEGEAKEKETAEEDIRSVPAMKYPILFVFY